MIFSKPKFSLWASALVSLTLFSTAVLSQGCSATVPCAVGCCSKYGFCGLGKDFCAKDVCVNNCERKAECDPGGMGSDFVERETCPLNVCCSKYGFCGMTEEFCGNKKPNRPSCSVKSHGLKRVVGYYEGWSAARPCNRFYPEQIPLGIYTHLNFAFATINPASYELQPGSTADKKMYERLTFLKTVDPDLKVFIAVGGWTFNDPGPTATTFSDIVSDSNKSARFIASIVKFLNTYDFDGIDLDWEYPAAKDRSGRDEDFKNFPIFMKKLKAALKTTGGRDGLSITLPASFWYLRHFDIKALEPHIDFFNMMTYDFHGTWDMENKWIGPYLNAHTNLTEIEEAMDLLWRNDIDSDKVVLGMAFYGRAFTMADPSCNKPGCPYASGGSKLACSGEISVALNSEIEKLASDSSNTPQFYQDAAVKVLQYNNNQWVSYDDEETFQLRTDFARSQCLGGVMVWAVSHDNEKAANSYAVGRAVNRKASFVNAGLSGSTEGNSGYDTVTQKHDQCMWTNCLEECPSGWVRMKRGDSKARKDEYMTSQQYCNKHGQRQLCCPPDADLPTCGWYTHNNGRCDANTLPITHLEIGSTDWYCKSGYQAASCSVAPTSMHVWNTCLWSKAWPHCDSGTCDSGMPSLFESASGSGGSECRMSARKSVLERKKYCCRTDLDHKWTDCEWYENAGTLPEGLASGTCMGGCPNDKYTVSLDAQGGSCKSGARAMCCSSDYKTITKRRSSADDEFDFMLNLFLQSKDGCTQDQSTSQYRAQLVIISNLQKLLFGANQQSSVDIWDGRVGLLYANLKVKALRNWVQQDTVASNLGSSQFPRRLLCALLLYDARLGGTSLFKCECDRPDCCESKLCPRSSSNSLSARGLLEIPSTNITRDSESWEYGGIWSRNDDDEDDDESDNLDRRAKDGYVYDVYSPYTHTQVTGLIKWLPYPTRGEWKAGDSIFQRGIDYASTDCNDIDVIQFALTTVTVRTLNFVTEHIFERQTVRDFIEATISDKLPGDHKSRYGPIDPSFWTITAVQKLTGPSQKAFENTPINNIMNAIGSKYNTRPFVLCGSKLNNRKLQLWGKNDPVEASRIKKLREDTTHTNEYLTQVRGPISALMYLNNQIVRDTLVIILKDIQAELSVAEAVHQAATGVDVQAVLRFNEWAAYFFGNMVSRAQKWVVSESREGKGVYKTIAAASGVAAVATLDSLWNLVSDYEVDEAILEAIANVVLKE